VPAVASVAVLVVALRANAAAEMSASTKPADVSAVVGKETQPAVPAAAAAVVAVVHFD
jgi:hypothetical protein